MTTRNTLAWAIMNLGLKLADPWYRAMIVGSVYYGMDQAAKDAGYRGHLFYPPDHYRKEVIRSLIREGERYVEREGQG